MIVNLRLVGKFHVIIPLPQFEKLLSLLPDRSYTGSTQANSENANLGIFCLSDWCDHLNWKKKI